MFWIRYKWDVHRDIQTTKLLYRFENNEVIRKNKNKKTQNAQQNQVRLCCFIVCRPTEFVVCKSRVWRPPNLQVLVPRWYQLKIIPGRSVPSFFRSIKRLEINIPIIKTSAPKVGVLDWWKGSGVKFYSSVTLIPKLYEYNPLCLHSRLSEKNHNYIYLWYLVYWQKVLNGTPNCKLYVHRVCVSRI